MDKDILLKSIEDIGRIIELIGDDDPDEVAKLEARKAKLEGMIDADGNIRSENLSEISQELQDAYSLVNRMEDLASTAAKKQEIARRVSDFGNAVTGVLDFVKGSEQIRESEQALEDIEPYTPQRKYKRSDELARRIRETRQEGSEAGIRSRTAAGREAIESQYQEDLNRASVASGGQAGVQQALSQVAARNRIRNLLGLNQQAEGFRDQTRRNMNYLATQDVAQNQAADVSERSRASLDYQRFRDAQQAAGQGIAAGELNRRLGRNEFLDAVASMAPSLYRPPEAPARRELPPELTRISPQMESFSPANVPLSGVRQLPPSTSNPQSLPSLSIPSSFSVSPSTGVVKPNQIDFNYDDAIDLFSSQLNWNY